MSEKTHYKKLINPDFFGAYCIPEGEDLNVKIESVKAEECTVEKGKKEVLTVARLVNQKPFILNATNSKSIAKIYGPYVEDWVGKTITTYITTTKLKGEEVECVRVRADVKPPKPKMITDAKLSDAIESIKKGDFTIERLAARFVLTDAQLERVKKDCEVQNAFN